MKRVSATPPPSVPYGSTPGTALARPRPAWKFPPYRRARLKLRSAKPAHSGARLKCWSIRSKHSAGRSKPSRRIWNGSRRDNRDRPRKPRKAHQIKDLTAELDRLRRYLKMAETADPFGQSGFPSVRQAQEALNNAALDLERTTVTAPADGIVANFQLTEGTYTQPGVPVATLIDTTRWRLIAAVPENWLEKIRPGDEVYYSLRNYPGHIRTAKVEHVGRGVVQGQGVPSGNLPDTDPRRIRQTDTPQAGQEFQVVIHLQDDQPDQPLRVGATGRATHLCRRRLPSRERVGHNPAHGLFLAGLPVSQAIAANGGHRRRYDRRDHRLPSPPILFKGALAH